MPEPRGKNVENLLRATHRGKLFDGLMDCYVLDDGRRVVSSSGVVRALRGADSDGARDGNLERYLSRLPGKFQHLATAPKIRISRPEGGVAMCFESKWLVELLKAYSESGDADQLHHTQRHLARNARKILLALAGVGIIALIDEASGYQHERHEDELGFLFRAILRDQSGDWQLTFGEDLVTALCRLHGENYGGGSHPPWLASSYQKIYRLVLGDKVYDELKIRNPNPSHGSNHHQWLTPEAKRHLDKELPIVCALANTSGSKEEFWARLEHRYAQQPLQLPLAKPRRVSARPGVQHA